MRAGPAPPHPSPISASETGGAPQGAGRSQQQFLEFAERVLLRRLPDLKAGPYLPPAGGHALQSCVNTNSPCRTGLTLGLPAPAACPPDVHLWASVTPLLSALTPVLLSKLTPALSRVSPLLPPLWPLRDTGAQAAAEGGQGWLPALPHPGLFISGAP